MDLDEDSPLFQIEIGYYIATRFETAIDFKTNPISNAVCSFLGPLPWDESVAETFETRRKLAACDGVGLSPKLVSEFLGSMRNDWESAFLFLLWAGRQPGYNHSTREYNSTIYILGKMRKFDTAWSLVDEMSKVKDDVGSSLVTPHTLLILIGRYCADVWATRGLVKIDWSQAPFTASNRNFVAHTSVWSQGSCTANSERSGEWASQQLALQFRRSLAGSKLVRVWFKNQS